MPSNNLSTAPCAEEFGPDPEGKCIVCKTLDAGSDVKLYDHIGETAKVGFARLQGEVVGVVQTKGGKIQKPDGKKITKLVSFCDAFSIPVITFLNSEGIDFVFHLHSFQNYNWFAFFNCCTVSNLNIKNCTRHR